jgi:hypothetical protein
MRCELAGCRDLELETPSAVLEVGTAVGMVSETSSLQLSRDSPVD